jgi:hypothetical protein
VPTRRVIFAIALVVTVAWWFAARTGEAGVAIPPPTFDPADANATGTAVLAGGCFWGVQAVFEHVRGVSQVTAGYSGGAKPNPTATHCWAAPRVARKASFPTLGSRKRRAVALDVLIDRTRRVAG